MCVICNSIEGLGAFEMDQLEGFGKMEN